MTSETTKSPNQVAPKTLDQRHTETRGAFRVKVTALGHVWQEHPTSCGPPSASVDGIPLYLEVAEEGRGYSVRRSSSARLRIKFGDYGDRHQFPEPKAGFDAKRLAEAISGFVKGQVARRKASDEPATRVRETCAIAEAINAEVGGPSCAYATVSDRSGTLMVRVVDAHCTEEQARALLLAAKQILGAKR